jgi:hypothetical protein
MKRHPSEAQLALAAGRDLGWVAAWKIRRHTMRCEACRKLYAAYEAFSEKTLGLAGETLPAGMSEEQWRLLAAEMQANIHVGLAAGACVRGAAFGLREWKPVWAYAAVLVLVVAGVWLQRRAASPPVGAQEGPVLAATANGIELTQGSRTLGLRQNAGESGSVAVSVGAQGSVRAQYVDQDTGYVVIQNVVQVQ